MARNKHNPKQKNKHQSLFFQTPPPPSSANIFLLLTFTARPLNCGLPVPPRTEKSYSQLGSSLHSPQMMSRAAFVMKGKTSTGFPVSANGSNRWTRTAPCSANTSQKPSRMLKWNVGVMSLRCWNHRSPVVVVIIGREMRWVWNGTRRPSLEMSHNLDVYIRVWFIVVLNLIFF